PQRKQHHAALPYSEVPNFIAKLRNAGSNEIVKLALEGTILTACRTGELLGARPDEVDFEDGLWIVPPDRMKAHREHRVPLPPRCVEIFREAMKLSGGSYIFAGRRWDMPLSSMAMLMVL